jgi:hypothetical protein
LLNLETLNACTVPGGSRYHPLYAPLILSEVVFNSMQPVWLALALALFFSRKRLFPRVMIALLSVTALFIIGDAFIAAQLPAAKALFDPSTFGAIAQSLTGAAIWIPYYLVSQRVQATFLR